MNKIRIGFGPEVTANSFYQAGIKVSRELQKDPQFACGTFTADFSESQLGTFDILVFIKIAPDYVMLKRLKDNGKILILDYQDMFLFPSVYERNAFKKIVKKIYYFGLERNEKRRYQLFDKCLVSSPVAEEIVREVGIESCFIFRQIFNDWNEAHSKNHSDKKSNLKILWTGVELNLPHNKPVEPVLKKLCERYDSRLLYLTQSTQKIEGVVEYKPWSLETWEKDLLEADIAFRWWVDCNDQYHKDSNKVISYMAAGLPVVCRPTPSDKLVIRDGETGFFAETVKSFENKIEQLIKDPELRKRVGQNAHQDAWSKYSLKQHVQQLKGFFLELLDAK